MHKRNKKQKSFVYLYQTYILYTVYHKQYPFSKVFRMFFLHNYQLPLLLFVLKQFLFKKKIEINLSYEKINEIINKTMP